VNELKSPDKPFEISKWAVQEAWEKVKANKGAPGVDGVSIEGFEADLHNNLYKVWLPQSRCDRCTSRHPWLVR
jgi:retron-type reverse transcriptase